MTQFPLTPTGVKQKQLELYALPNNQLKQQSDLIYTGFSSWMQSNFVLDSDQVAWISTTDTTTLRFLATQVSTAVAFRLEIVLDAPINKIPIGSKFVIIKPLLIVTRKPTETLANGSLMITFGQL